MNAFFRYGKRIFPLILIIFQCTEMHIQMKDYKKAEYKEMRVYLSRSFYERNEENLRSPYRVKQTWQLSESCPPDYDFGEIAFVSGFADSIVCYRKSRSSK